MEKDHLLHASMIRSFPNGVCQSMGGIRNIPNGVCQSTEGIRNFPNGICQSTEGIRNFPSGVCQSTEGVRSFLNGICQSTGGIRNFPNGVCRAKHCPAISFDLTAFLCYERCKPMIVKPKFAVSFLLVVAVSLMLLLRQKPLAESAAQAPTASAQVDFPQAAKHKLRHSARPAAHIAPTARMVTSHGEEWQLALDEATSHQPDGEHLAVALNPPATLETLRERLAEIHAWPIAYPAETPRKATSRRTITPDLSVKIDDATLATLLRNYPLTLKERPDYAPGWVILSAADALAAVAVVDAVRQTRGVVEADVIVSQMRFKKALPNDSLIAQQWHLANNSSTRTHANVESIWNFPNVTGVRGAGIRIGIIDDGIDLTHPDFVGNLDTANDRDFIGNDNDPTASSRFEDFHGTACAGVAAARGNNNLGVSGVAPSATLVGLRLVTSEASATDALEASAMGWRNDIIQVKSNSWGPQDTGDVLISQRPGSLTLAALANAATTGRGGKGTIFVWAGGNGGSTTDRDHSNYDGYANSIYTIAVAACNSSGTRSDYSESGANLVVCAPSDGIPSQLAITTTDLVGNLGYNTSSGLAGNYATDFGGTSSATPVVSGTVALMLEKNPNLGWRDVQEILIRSAFKISAADSGWANNSAALHFHPQFGAGLVDATAAVNLATGWTNLTPQTIVTSSQTALSVAIPDNNATGITRTFVISDSLRVEQLTLRLSASHTNHRNLDIFLTSPSGMVSQMGVSAASKAGEALTNWTFSSVRHWGENSAGTWTLRITDRVSGTTGSLTAAELQLFGTSSTPVNQAPIITAATLSEITNGFADRPLAVSSITASDAENNPLSYTYQWQASTDGINFASQPPPNTATLTADPSRTGKLWRCVISASDGTSNSQPFTTAAVNLLTRPPATAAPGSAFSYTSGLVLAGNVSTFSRPAIINEFSQGPSGGTSEWVEILTLKATSLRFHDLQSAGRIVVFRDSAVWDNIPAGTLIVVYNGLVVKDPRLPADDINPSDGTMVISSTNSTYFDPSLDYDLWLALGNSGDYITLNDADGNVIHGLSYGSNATVSPNIGAVGSQTSAFFTGNQEASASLASSWSATNQANSSPALGNNTANTSFVTTLRSGSGNSPALFRLGSGITLPAGLTLNPSTGIIAGTIATTATPGNYPITIERFNATPSVVAQSFSLAVIATPSFATWIATFAPMANVAANADPDADSLPNLVEYALNLNPKTPEGSPRIVFQANGSSIQLTYRVHKAHTDVALTPEWASSLHGSSIWSSTSITTTVVEETADTQLRRASLPINPANPQRFLRLRATIVPSPAP